MTNLTNSEFVNNIGKCRQDRQIKTVMSTLETIRKYRKRSTVERKVKYH